MSKALEAAWKAFNDACAAEAKDTFMRMDSGEPLSSIKHRPTAPLEAAISAYLAHLAEDEAVVERMASAIMKVQGYEILHQDTPDVDDQTIAAFEDAFDCAKEEARAALKSLAGKE